MTRDCKQFRVMTTTEWVATHGPHGKATVIPAEHQPPRGTYQINTLLCPCGAKHVVTEAATTKQPETLNPSETGK